MQIPRRPLFLLMVMLLVSGAYAIDLRILGGIDFSRSTKPLAAIVSEIYPVPEYGVGALFGIGIEFPLFQTLTLEVDGLYFQKGSRVEWKWWTGDPVGHSIERLNELSLPVLLRYYLRPGTSPYLLGGGELAFNLSKESDPNNYGLVSQRTDYGLVLGVGFRKQIRGGSLSFEGRYNHGLHDMASDFSMLRKMRVFSLLVGFSF